MTEIRNYWLSELLDDDVEYEDDAEIIENDDNMDLKGMLSMRQLFMYDKYEEIVEDFGMFDWSDGPNGAHYMPAAKNPFKESGLACKNCVFYINGGGCEIVKGKIQPGAVCKLWIIPEELIKQKGRRRKK